MKQKSTVRNHDLDHPKTVTKKSSLKEIYSEAEESDAEMNPSKKRNSLSVAKKEDGEELDSGVKGKKTSTFDYRNSSMPPPEITPEREEDVVNY